MKRKQTLLLALVFGLLALLSFGCNDSGSDEGDTTDDDDDDQACETAADCPFGYSCVEGVCVGDQVDGDVCDSGAMECDASQPETPVKVCGVTGTWNSFACLQACQLYEPTMQQYGLIPDCCDCDALIGDDDDDNTTDDDDDDDDDDDVDLTCSAEDPSCPVGYTCNEDEGICEQSGCENDEDCPTKFHCEGGDTANGVCEPNTCVDDPGMCGECTYCDEATETCVPDTESASCFPDPEEEQPCSVTGGSEAKIVVSTTQLDFGAVAIGSRNIQPVWVCNAGGEGTTLSITSLQTTTDTSTEFYIHHATLPVSIPSGKQKPVYVIYTPNDNVADNGTLNILTNDQTQQQTDVQLISAIKPQAYVEVYPRIINFSGQSTKQVRATNIGTAATLVDYPVVVGASAGNFEILECAFNGTTAITANASQNLEVGEFVICVLSFDGGADENDGESQMVFQWYTDTSEEESSVALRPGGQPSCAVANAGPDQIVPPLATVVLDGSASMDPDADDLQVTGYKWRFLSKPEGADTAILQTSSGANIGPDVWVDEAHPQFFAELAGDYEIELAVRDSYEDCSGVNTDTVLVRVVPSESIHIQLMWTMSGNDQDLHLVKPNGTYSRSSSGNTTDCHYANCNTRNGSAFPCPARGCPGPAAAPDWGVIGDRADDPTLDIDDISAVGPENINLSLPEAGDYLVGVEYFSGSGNPQDIVRIWLFGVLMGTFPLEWSQQSCGSCSNWHWEVAYLRVVDAANISIVPIGQIVQSN